MILEVFSNLDVSVILWQANSLSIVPGPKEKGP